MTPAEAQKIYEAVRKPGDRIWVDLHANLQACFVAVANEALRVAGLTKRNTQ